MDYPKTIYVQNDENAEENQESLRACSDEKGELFSDGKIATYALVQIVNRRTEVHLEPK